MEHDVPEVVLTQAVDLVLSGGIILYPTDTVYGLGGDATNPAPSKRIRALKGSGVDKPLIVLTDSWDRVSEWIGKPDALTAELMDVGLHESLTILFPAQPSAPREVIGSSSEIGIRVCRHPFCARLIAGSGKPISSTSANTTGSPTPLRLNDIEDHIRGGVDLEIDGGELAGAASTIVRSAGRRPQVVREGSVTIEVLRHLLK
jgi:L-threonylcarbamoyladenylate synthase